jgi:transposase-like protein
LISFLKRKKEYFALHNIVQKFDNNTYFEKKYKCKECNKDISITYEKKENIFNLFYLSSYCDFCHKDLCEDIYKNIDTEEIFDLNDFTERHNIYSSEKNYNKTICLQCLENEDMERENTKDKTSRFKKETNIQKNNDFEKSSDLNASETDDFDLSDDEDEWDDPNSYANCSD